MQTKVVGNFRENDLNLNGQGAPLVPIYHQAIFSKPSKNFLVINIGGISNYTLLIGENKIFSSDIGPGNVLLDNFCQKYFNINCDFEGVNSLMGKINFDLIDLWKKKIINQKHPISFDNFSFKLEDYIFQQINLNDNLRSLTYFTACLICDLEKKLNSKLTNGY